MSDGEFDRVFNRDASRAFIRTPTDAHHSSMNEVCPNCGDFVANLWELTGWCNSCSIRHGRTCTHCHTKQPIENFSRDSRRSSGRLPICRSCHSATRRTRRNRLTA